jgi:hypothetical protein
MEDMRAGFRQVEASGRCGDHGAAARVNETKRARGKPCNKLFALLNSLHYCLGIFIPS